MEIKDIQKLAKNMYLHWRPLASVPYFSGFHFKRNPSFGGSALNRRLDLLTDNDEKLILFSIPDLSFERFFGNKKEFGILNGRFKLITTLYR
jgi:hypothetical protein